MTPLLSLALLVILVVAIVTIILMYVELRKLEKITTIEVTNAKAELDHVTRLILATLIIMNVSPEIITRESADLQSLTNYLQRMKDAKTQINN